MNKLMCAKFVVVALVLATGAEGNTVSETITFRAVSKSDGYPEDGKDENNSYALWTPAADLKMTISNPALFGKYKEGDEVYVHFSTPGNVEPVPETPPSLEDLPVPPPAEETPRVNPEDPASGAVPVPLPDIAVPESAPSAEEVPPPSVEALKSPTVGRTVLFVLEQAHVDHINDQRARSEGQLRGNPVAVGEVYPLIVSRVWPDLYDGTGVNGQVQLDGNDSLWVTSVTASAEPKGGHWHWPVRD